MPRWVKQWAVPSSSGDGNYIVSQDAEGNYACGCPGWTRHMPRTNCKHIVLVLLGRGRTLEEAVMDKITGRDPARGIEGKIPRKLSQADLDRIMGR